MNLPCPTCKQYKVPSTAVDGLIYHNGQVLLIQRRHDPFKDCYAFPGGFVEYGEDPKKTVVNEVWEETGLKTEIDQLVGVYGAPDRDPRSHIMSIAYSLRITGGEPRASDDAKTLGWFPIDNLPPLAFDHQSIVNDFRLNNKITGEYQGWNLNKKLVFCSQSRHLMYLSLIINKYVIEHGSVPINSFTNFGYFLSELVRRHDVVEGINNIMNRCDEQWVFGPITPGVDMEIEFCKKIGKPTRFFHLKEDPTAPPTINEVDEQTLRSSYQSESKNSTI